MAKVYIKTFGCQMNEYDSDKVADVLRDSHDLQQTDNPAEADVILFNTCSVREKAQEKVFHDLGRVRQFKAANPKVLIGVGLCMVFYGIIYAILENDMRRILAYSIVNQVGFMVTGIGIGTDLALDGAASHAFAHILYKALLLMSADHRLGLSQPVRSVMSVVLAPLQWLALLPTRGTSALEAYFTGVDEARRRMDDKSETTERTLAFDARDEMIGHGNALEG